MIFGKRSLVPVILLAFSLLLLSCREITTVTTVNSDGSCDRIVKVKSKHKTHDDSYFPIPTDSTWTITNTKNEQDTAFYNYTASQTFRDVKSMQATYASYADTDEALRLTVELKKRFGLFFRYYRYREVYDRYSPYDKVPVEDFLTRDELRIYLSDQDSAEIKDKVEEWRARAMFEELYQALVTKSKALESPEVTPEKLEANKDTLFHAVIENADSTADVLFELTKILQTYDVTGLRDTIDTVLKRIDRDLDVILQVGANDYTNKVVMPGLLLDTNADAVEGNMATWDFSGKVFEFREKEMWVQSRLINWWGISFSGLLLLILLGALIVVARHRTS